MRSWIILACVLAFASLSGNAMALPPLAQAGATPVSQAAQPPKQQWEYATIVDGDVLVSFREPSRGFCVDNSQPSDWGMYNLYLKLGGKVSREDPVNPFTLCTLFNLLGDQGWELISITKAPAGTQYVFKRAKLNAA